MVNFLGSTDMTRFAINFLSRPTDRVPALDAYKAALLNYDEDAWAVSQHGGANFSAITDDGVRLSLVLTAEKGKGITLSTTVRGVNGRKREGFTSVGDAQRMGEFVKTGDEFYVPAGSFITPEQAWFAVEDFCTNPEVASPRVHWVPTGTLTFPSPIE